MSEKSMFDFLSQRCICSINVQMKDILRRRPTLSDLTGISRSRLDSLGTHLQAYLVSPSLAEAQESCWKGFLSTSSTTLSRNPKLDRPHHQHTSISTHASSLSSQLLSKGMACLSPRGSTCFKDGASSPSSLSAVGGIRDSKLTRCPSTEHHVGLLAIPLLPFDPHTTPQSPPLLGPGAVGSLSAGLPPEFSPFNPLTFQFPLSSPNQASSNDKPLFKPHYCWCPIGASPLPPVPSNLPPIPPVPPPAVIPSLSLSLVSSDLTKVLHDPLVHLPLPVSSLVIPPLTASTQFPVFTGLMSDPIVHLPVMDIRSSGQAYLVSAGPALSTTIPPLVGKSLVPSSELALEKNARETLMRLLESAPTPNGLVLDPVLACSSNPICAVDFGANRISRDIPAIAMGSGSSLKEDAASKQKEQEEEMEGKEYEACQPDDD